MVGVILASAYLRLQLYEQAYGFTRLRAYTHVAIIWMGVAFVLFLVLLFAGNLRAFAPAAVGVALGFALTLNLLNVDDFIVRRNAERARAGSELDIVLPDEPERRCRAGAWPRLRPSSPWPCVARSCHGWPASWPRSISARRQGWPSTHLSVLRARSALEPWREILSAYHVDTEGPRYSWTVEDAGGEMLGCFYPTYD